MPMPVIAIQYLEDSPHLDEISPATLVDRLRAAFERLPFTHLLVGWHLPQPVLEACRREAEKLGLRFMRWQPLLVSDGGFEGAPTWYTEGLDGSKVIDSQARPDFTFFCPNHPEAREGAVSHIHSLVEQGLYQGFFLDRARFPSPSADPLGSLACFCEYCRQKAGEAGVDLNEIRNVIRNQAATATGASSLVRCLLAPEMDVSGSPLEWALAQLLHFRQVSIVDFLTQACAILRGAHLEIGLDCFSPCLAGMVGQDLQALGPQADWVKVMTYAHTNAPAGLPYELGGLARFLETYTSLNQEQALRVISECIGLALPRTWQALQRDGLGPGALEKEVQRGIQLAATPVLAGIELVDLPGLTHLNPAQIRSDLVAIRRAAPAGLAISWDLLHIPMDWLELVTQVYTGPPRSPA